MDIKKTVQSIQHLRNSALSADKQAAIAALSASTLTARDGEIILNRYGSGDNVKTIFAINYVPGNNTEATGHNVTIFDFDKEAMDAITTQINNIEERVVALSGDSASTSADTSVAGAKKYTDDKIATLDHTDTAVEGEYVSQVTETDGVIAVTRVALPDLAEVHEAGKPIIAVSENKGQVAASAGKIDAQYVNIDDAGGVFSSTTVEAALAEIDDAYKAADAAIVDNASESANTLAKLEEIVNEVAGDAKSYAISAVTGTELSDLGNNVKEAYKLVDEDGTKSGEYIKVYKDNTLKSVELSGQNLVFTYIVDSGESVVSVDVSTFLVESEFESGVTANADGVVHGVVDSKSEEFLTVGAGGFKLSGVQDAIDAAVAALDVSGDTAVAGQYVAAIEETDGVVAVKKRANVSEAVLNNYSKGSDSGAVAATDSVNQAISKLENQIDVVEAEAAASKTIVELSAGTTHLTITSVTDPSNSAITFTLGENDIASKTDLDTLGGKAVTVVEMTGGTIASAVTADGTKKITINTDGSQINLTGYDKGSDSGAVAATDSVNAAVGKLENQVIAAREAAEAAISGLDATITAETGYYINKVDEVDGKISGTTAALPSHAAIFEAGKPITAVAESLGEISATAGTINAEYVNVTGSTFSSTTVQGALEEIETEYKAADAAIVGDATINGNTLGKLEDRIDALDADAATYTIRKDTQDLPATVKERYTLVETKNGQSTDKQVVIDIPKDSHIVSINYISAGTHAQNLEYVYIDASGNTQTTYADMSELVLEAEFASGVTVTDHIIHGVVDSTSEKDGQNNAFLTVGENGFKVAGVQNAINTTVATEIGKLDATAGTQTIASGKHVAVEVVEADGKVTAVTVTESDIASASALTAEIAARKAVDGVNGDAYTADKNAHYISGASTLFGADQALDTAMYELSGKVNSNEVVSGNGISVTATQDNKTQVAVRLGSVDSNLEDALTFNNKGDLAFTGIIDAGVY